MAKWILSLSFSFGMVCSWAQDVQTVFTIVGTYGSFTGTDSLYTGSATFYADQLGESYFPTGIDSGFIALDGFRNIYRVDSVWAKTSNSASLRLIDLSAPYAAPVGTGEIYEPIPGLEYLIPPPPVNSTGIPPNYASVVHINNLRRLGRVIGSGQPLIDTVTVATPHPVLTPLHFDGSNWILASEHNLDFAWGIVVDSIDAVTVGVQYIGTANIPAHGLTVGSFYSLDSLAYTISTNIDSSQYDQWLWEVPDVDHIEIKLSSHVQPPYTTPGGGGAASNTFYTSSEAITSDRVVDLAGNDLTFSDDSGNGRIIFQNDNSSNIFQWQYQAADSIYIDYNNSVTGGYGFNYSNGDTTVLIGGANSTSVWYGSEGATYVLPGDISYDASVDSIIGRNPITNELGLIAISDLGGGAIVSASNGLRDDDVGGNVDVELGGSLDKDTDIELDINKLTLTRTGAGVKFQVDGGSTADGIRISPSPATDLSLPLGAFLYKNSAAGSPASVSWSSYDLPVVQPLISNTNSVYAYNPGGGSYWKNMVGTNSGITVRDSATLYYRYELNGPLTRDANLDMEGGLHHLELTDGFDAAGLTDSVFTFRLAYDSPSYFKFEFDKDIGAGVIVRSDIQVDDDEIYIRYVKGANATIFRITPYTVVIESPPSYVNDAAADADVNLPSGGVYTITGSRVMYIKP